MIFNIADIQFEESYVNEEYNTITLYFIAPKNYVNESTGIVQTAISVELPLNHLEPRYASVEMSPTRETEEGGLEDYGWFDISLPYEDIDRLITLWEKHICNKYKDRIMYDKS